MLKRPHCCAFIIGAALVVLAVILVARLEGHAPVRHDPATVTLAQAVSHLNSDCLTCHRAGKSSPAGAAPAALHAAPGAEPGDLLMVLPDRQPWSDSLVSALPTVPTPQAGDIAALRDLGWRLLRLPSHDRAAGPVIAAYLNWVEATRPAADLAAPAAALWRLSDLEAWVRVLEHRAAPVQWTVPDRAPVPDGTSAAVLATAPVPPAGWAMLPAAVALVAAESWTALEAPHLGLPYEVIFGTQRRGPPAPESVVVVMIPVLGMGDCGLAGGLPFFWQTPVQWLSAKTAEPFARWCCASLSSVRRGYYVT